MFIGFAIQDVFLTWGRDFSLKGQNFEWIERSSNGTTQIQRFRIWFFQIPSESIENCTLFPHLLKHRNVI